MSTMRNRTLLGAVVTAALLGLAPTAAVAAAPVPAAAPAAVAADGTFYAWEHAGYTGVRVGWVGDSSDWNDRGMRNRASSVHNNGYAGAYDDVRMYWGTGYSGASYCLANGGYLANMTLDHFPYNGTGGGEAMNDNVASHRWVNSC